MNVYKWSTSQANNNSAVPDGAPEGWTGADVNYWGRETMAAVRALMEDSTYIEITYQLASVGAKSLTRVSATRIDILACDATAYFVADRRIKIVGATTGYGVVVSSTFSTDTQVTVTMEAADVPTAPTAIYVHVDSTVRNSAFKKMGSGNALDADTVDTYHATDFFSLIGRGALFGLGIANSSGDSANDIDVTTGICLDSTHAAILKFASAITKRMDATWAAATGNGGRAAGVSYSASTWYHVFALGSAYSATTDIGFDTSVTAANLLADAAVVSAGHTKYRRLGSFLTNATPTIIAFSADGDEFLWSVVPALDVDVTNQSTSAVSRTLTVPLGVKVRAIINAFVDHGSESNVYLSSPDQSDVAASITASPLASINLVTGRESASGPMIIRTNTSSQIRSRADASSTTLRIATLGWLDSRGKNA